MSALSGSCADVLREGARSVNWGKSREQVSNREWAQEDS